MSTTSHINTQQHSLTERERAGRSALALAGCLALLLALAGALVAVPARAQEATAGSFALTAERQGQGASAVLVDGPACRRSSPAVYCGKVLFAGTGTTSELYDPLASDPEKSWSGCPAGDGACGSPLRPGNLSVNLTQPRAGATLTLLDGPACKGTAAPDYCGKVLLVGGIQALCTGLQNCLPGGQGYPTAPEARVELYDPAKGRWSSCDFDEPPSAGCPAPYPGGKLKDHSATPLSDGRVLIAGGFLEDIDSATRSGREDFYFYDPAVGTWSGPGVLYQRRRNHRAVQLEGGVDKCGANCGKVLLVGGSGSGDGKTQQTAELLDPTTRTSIGTPSNMITPRRLGHSATLLADGRVLVAGGDCQQAGCPNPGNTAEFFDPKAEATKAWVAAAGLRLPRYRHTATLLGTGKLLIAGFSDPAELYDPVAGTSLLTGSAAPKSPATATLFPRGPRSMCATSCGKVLLTDTNSTNGRLYTANPEVTALSPASGPVAGGTAVTLEGAGLASVTSVRFGDVEVEAASMTPDADSPDTKLIAISPAHATGTVPVTATSSGGRSATTQATQFTYTADSTSNGGDAGSGGQAGATNTLMTTDSAAAVPGATALTTPSTGARQTTAPLASRARTSQQTRRARLLRSCLTRVERHAKREVTLARRAAPRRRTQVRRHLMRHRSAARKRCLTLYGRTPGAVRQVTARATSSTQVVLSFLAAGTDAQRPPAARGYVVKQSLRPIRSARDFKHAQTLCARACRFAPSRVGERLELNVTDLRPRTTYYYAIAALDNVSRRLGKPSRPARVTTR